MTVYDNMAAALRSKLYKTDEETIKQKVYEAARMMKMENLLERLPSASFPMARNRGLPWDGLWCGRRMCFLWMNRSLIWMQSCGIRCGHELKEMQANLGSTCIYVTHDFMEAMALGDRIAIVNKGEIVQIGSGDEIYYMPCNEFVAQLMGSILRLILFRVRF